MKPTADPFSGSPAHSQLHPHRVHYQILTYQDLNIEKIMHTEQYRRWAFQRNSGAMSSAHLQTSFKFQPTHNFNYTQCHFQWNVQDPYWATMSRSMCLTNQCRFFSWSSGVALLFKPHTRGKYSIPTGPIPCVLCASTLAYSWNSQQHHLQNWIGRSLWRDYPNLSRLSRPSRLVSLSQWSSNSALTPFLPLWWRPACLGPWTWATLAVSQRQ